MMLQIHTGEGACPAAYDDPCTNPNELCCSTNPNLHCVQVATNVYKCKDDTTCEDHHDHECYPGYFDCCTGLNCVELASGKKCKEGTCEDHSGHECTPGVFECCPGTGLDCTQVSFSPEVYQCL